MERRIEHRRRAEIRLLETHISKDPSNAAYFGRVSELYEVLGKKEQALEAARMAEKLEPTARNRYRVEALEKE
jgi:cytochrome c-type biogenesis protein CcmH/NrfG